MGKSETAQRLRLIPDECTSDPTLFRPAVQRALTADQEPTTPYISLAPIVPGQ
jgi:hypothetical protein